jgi:hypothetical protein
MNCGMDENVSVHHMNHRPMEHTSGNIDDCKRIERMVKIDATCATLSWRAGCYGCMSVGHITV